MAAAPFPQAAWNRRVVALPTVFAGSVEEGQRTLQTSREMGETLFDLSGLIPFRALQGAFDASFPAGGRYYWKSATLPALDAKAIEALVDIGATLSSPQTAFGIWQMGGAISRIADAATGFGPRSDPWTLTLDSGWTDPAEDDHHIAFTRGVWEKLRSISGGGMYIHYGYLDKEEQIKAAYGPVYARLAEIKARYDPLNLFRVNQNIKPSA